VEAAAGNISLHGHIDYVYRYSQESNDDDWDESWNGYDTQNLEFAVLGMSGQVGDNVSWVISYAFAFAGPYGATNSETLTNTNDSAGMLLDARINLNLMDSVQLSFGRFIPPTSMTWCPHKMDSLHTVNYPLVNGSGVAVSEYGYGMLPLPMYQTGMMLTAMMGPAQIMIGGFNGNQFIGGDDTGEVGLYGMNNTMDIDRNKGILAKVAVSQEGMHFGGWYYAEDASINTANYGPVTTNRATIDGKSARWGIEAAYTANNLLLAGEYINSTFDSQDSDVDDDLQQDGWYILAGYTMSQVQFLVRYDQVNYDKEEEILVPDGHPNTLADPADPADYNEETATTIGLNYFLNEQTTVGLNYTMRDLEEYESNTDELALIIELDLF